MSREEEITLALKTLRRQYPGGGAFKVALMYTENK
jgi:hypothetical protein